MTRPPRSRKSAAVVLLKEQHHLHIVPVTTAAQPSAAVPAAFFPPTVIGLRAGGEEQFGKVPRHLRYSRNVSMKKTRQNLRIPDGCCVNSQRSNLTESENGNHEDVKNSGKGKSSPPKTARKRRKSQIDSRLYTPKSRVRGQSRGQNKLDSGTFDDILEIVWNGLSEEKRSSFARLNCMWFNMYAEQKSRNVVRWIKRENIFSKHYVFVPIVMWSHWSLLILCHFGERLESEGKTPCMLLLDSMQQIGPERLEPDIRKFVFDIHKSVDLPVTKKSMQKIPLLFPKVPQQKDADECGKYVLYFIDLFLENAPESINISKGYPYFMKEDWFSNEGLDNFWKRCCKIKKDCRENEGKSKSEEGIEDDDIIELTEGFV